MLMPNLYPLTLLPICVGSDNSVKGYNLVTPLSIANKTIPDEKDGCEPDKAELAFIRSLFWLWWNVNWLVCWFQAFLC